MSGIWPDDTRCVVVLSFDVDGVSGALNQNPDAARLPTFMSMREFGPSVGTPRILDLLDEYDIKASFFIPGYVAETPRGTGGRHREARARGRPPRLHPRAPRDPVQGGRGGGAGQGHLHHRAHHREKPKGYRSPSWELSEHSLSLLADRGFLYDTSLMGNDIPYFVDADGRQLVEIPVQWELDDAPYYTYAPTLGRRNPMASPQHVYQVWSAAFEGLYHYGRCLVLTMHPHTSGHAGRLRMVERLIRYMREFPGVRFMRAADLAEMWASKSG